MDFRMLDENWRADVMDLWDYCFEKKDDPFFQWYFSRYCRMTQVIGAVSDGRLLAMAHLNPYQLALRGKVIQTDYFVGVATNPEARGKGLFLPLLQHALGALREQGRGLTLLMPSSAGFYRPYGFAYCYHQWKIQCQLSQLAPLTLGKTSLSWKKGSVDDWLAFSQVYGKTMEHRHAYVCRNAINWQFILEALFAEGGYAFFAVNQAGEPAAYICFEIHADVLQVVEWLACDLSAQRACLAFLHQHRSQAGQVIFGLPEDDLLYEQIPDSSYSVSLNPFMMGRIVDVHQALQQCLPETAGSEMKLTLAVSDAIAPWNDGCWRISYNTGLTIEKVQTQTPEAKITIAALAQLCFGRYNTAQLAAKGEIEGRPDALRLLDRLLPVCCNYINEYY